VNLTSTSTTATCSSSRINSDFLDASTASSASSSADVTKGELKISGNNTTSVIDANDFKSFIPPFGSNARIDENILLSFDEGIGLGTLTLKMAVEGTYSSNVFNEINANMFVPGFGNHLTVFNSAFPGDSFFSTILEL